MGKGCTNASSGRCGLLPYPFPHACRRSGGATTPTPPPSHVSRRSDGAPPNPPAPLCLPGLPLVSDSPENVMLGPQGPGTDPTPQPQSPSPSSLPAGRRSVQLGLVTVNRRASIWRPGRPSYPFPLPLPHSHHATDSSCYPRCLSGRLPRSLSGRPHGSHHPQGQLPLHWGCLEPTGSRAATDPPSPSIWRSLRGTPCGRRLRGVRLAHVGSRHRLAGSSGHGVAAQPCWPDIMAHLQNGHQRSSGLPRSSHAVPHDRPALRGLALCGSLWGPNPPHAQPGRVPGGPVWGT